MSDPQSVSGSQGAGSEAVNSWEMVATEWENNRDRVFDGFRPVSDWLVEQVRPEPGHTILELAAGPGETGFLAAERIGPSGRLISTDLAPTMVQAARRGAEARQLSNVECRVMDAQQIDLPDDAVDAVISRLGLMLVPDPRATLSEARRVLRAGGRLAYAVMGTPDRNPWMSLMVGALMQAGHPPVGENPFQLGGVFGMSSPDINRDLLTAAGFSDVLAEELPGTMPFESIEDYWSFQAAVAGPVRVTIEKMTDDEVAAARGALELMMAPLESNGGYELPTLLVVVTAA